MSSCLKPLIIDPAISFDVLPSFLETTFLDPNTASYRVKPPVLLFKPLQLQWSWPLPKTTTFFELGVQRSDQVRAHTIITWSLPSAIILLKELALVNMKDTFLASLNGMMISHGMLKYPTHYSDL